MNKLGNRLLEALWSSPEEYSLTSHQKLLIEELDQDHDLRIYGGIGAGKTFAIRHFLREEGSEFLYLPASQLLDSTSSSELEDKVDGTEVVVVDNFDVIPKERTYLEQIHEYIEYPLSSYERSVWLVFPEDYTNEWFETVIRGMHIVNTQLNKMDTFTVDHLLSNLKDASPMDTVSPKINTDPAETFGYHTVVNSFIKANKE